MSAQAFWDAAAPLIAVTEKHPFLVAMVVDGTLNEATFQYYVVQDALSLEDFADCLSRCRLWTSAGNKKRRKDLTNLHIWCASGRKRIIPCKIETYKSPLHFTGWLTI